MILAADTKERVKFLERLQPIQSDDFYKIFKAAEGKSVNIRLLDPPLHEFLSKDDKTIAIIAEEIGVTVEQLKAKITSIGRIQPNDGTSWLSFRCYIS